MSAGSGRLPIEYVVPLRWSDDADLAEFTDYLRRLAGLVDITVVDGSEPEIFAGHAARWDELVRHLPVGRWPGRNRKVAGVVTGVAAARHELVVVADDDVRYGPEELRDMASRLGSADIVRPQNVFRPLPWHARWDTGRMLINRAFGSDYPGTLGVRRSAFLAAGGYDGDVLFENLQLIRTLRALWVGERAVTVWLAVLARLRGGVRYRGERMPRAGTRPVPGEDRDLMGLAA